MEALNLDPGTVSTLSDLNKMLMLYECEAFSNEAHVRAKRLEWFPDRSQDEVAKEMQQKASRYSSEPRKLMELSFAYNSFVLAKAFADEPQSASELVKAFIYNDCFYYSADKMLSSLGINGMVADAFNAKKGFVTYKELDEIVAEKAGLSRTPNHNSPAICMSTGAMNVYISTILNASIVEKRNIKEINGMAELQTKAGPITFDSRAVRANFPAAVHNDVEFITGRDYRVAGYILLRQAIAVQGKIGKEFFGEPKYDLGAIGIRKL